MLYPIAPVAIATKTEMKGVEFFSSIPSLKIQKKQKRPRSNKRPRAVPINSEIGAVLACSPDDKTYARANNPTISAAETNVLIFSARVHSGATVSDSPRPLLCAMLLLITSYPKQFQLGSRLAHQLCFRTLSKIHRNS